VTAAGDMQHATELLLAAQESEAQGADGQGAHRGTAEENSCDAEEVCDEEVREAGQAGHAEQAWEPEEEASELAAVAKAAHQALQTPHHSAQLLEQIEDAVDMLTPEAMVAATHAACMATLQEHLASHLHEHPSSTYDQWIAAVHPENVTPEGLDHRFYIEASEHRKLWNSAVEEGRRVAPAGSAEQDALQELLEEVRGKIRAHRAALCKAQPVESVEAVELGEASAELDAEMEVGEEAILPEASSVAQDTEPQEEEPVEEETLNRVIEEDLVLVAVPDTSPVLVAVPDAWHAEWDDLLEELREMGFHDQDTNQDMLCRSHGDIKATIKQLVDQERAARNSEA